MDHKSPSPSSLGTGRVGEDLLYHQTNELSPSHQESGQQRSAEGIGLENGMTQKTINLLVSDKGNEAISKNIRLDQHKPNRSKQ
ncbi:hypothetical protein PVK06_009055 [Gossypium arboreum]|uniref:Uncharacterized protein n=1 Tax=Gossypium arboreum TaxID=29729 RepID=A0ABR0QMA8_GOSAR|nr:hypothetical protein PVK06_009055 [Gossypium arboreum]